MRPIRPPDDGLPVGLLAVLSADVLAALNLVQFPAFASDNDRRVRWQNEAATALIGDVRGKLDTSLVAPEDLPVVRDAFARKQLGASHTHYEARLLRPDGGRVRLGISSVPLRNQAGRMIGAFVLARIISQTERPEPKAPCLTSRQRQTLAFLAAGRSTAQMAAEMGLAEETVRNHVKRLLRRLGVHSRVEAVARARAAKLL